MANLVGHPLAVVGSDLTAIDGPSSVTTANGLGQRNPVGTQAFDDSGNAYVYLAGVASLAAGDWVTYASATFVASRLVAAAASAGPVAVALAAAVASTWGWFQIYGFTGSSVNIATAAAGAGKALYASSTTGRASTTAVAAQMIFGAVALTNPAANAGQAFLSYPVVMQNSTV